MSDRLLRLLDVLIAGGLLIVLSPLLLLIAVVSVVRQGRPVLYRAPRVGRDGDMFLMKKFRTMAVGSDRGPTSTSVTDARITPLGTWLRRYKLDELPQLFNVVQGQMSLVGPRPQVAWAVAQYDEQTKDLLTVRPGMTDFASIWFSDEGERIAGASDPDEAYLQLIAPGKNALALAAVQTRSVRTYVRALVLTARALAGKDARPAIRAITGIDADALTTED